MTVSTEMPVGVREAAKGLGINASTVSRYLARHPELNRSGDGPPRVLLSELRLHRSDNVNEVMSGNHAGRLFGEAEADADPVAITSARERHLQSAPSSGVPGYAHAKTARETIQARRSLLALETDLKLVVSRRLVEDAAAEAGMALREGMAARNRDLSNRIATMADPHEIKAVLDEADTALLARIADALDRRIRGAEEHSE
jgi:hypothetical protein